MEDPPTSNLSIISSSGFILDFDDAWPLHTWKQAYVMELARHERKLATMCCGQFLLVLLMFSLTWKCRYPMIAAQNLLNMQTSGKGSHCPGRPGCFCRLNLMFFCWLNSNLSHCSNSPKVKKNLGSFPPLCSIFLIFKLTTPNFRHSPGARPHHQGASVRRPSALGAACEPSARTRRGRALGLPEWALRALR